MSKKSDEKCRTQKNADEMTFEEFVTWATAHVFFGIGEGHKLRDLMWVVISQATQNKVFGSAKDAAKRS